MKTDNNNNKNVLAQNYLTNYKKIIVMKLYNIGWVISNKRLRGHYTLVFKMVYISNLYEIFKYFQNIPVLVPLFIVA